MDEQHGKSGVTTVVDVSAGTPSRTRTRRYWLCHQLGNDDVRKPPE
jgi:hypothetical protein